ncbi:MAG: response regulator [Oscillospiraceae bacterium]|nr:response regulator [Oscillospiraceae bacterium]
MLKAFLADDEPNVRQGLKLMLPWEELGITIAGEGEDGDDGLKKIIELKPDIVIADIKMPGMTGIEMLEAAQKGGFTGKALILSGYSDFSYAKEAISLGVKKFILKPVDEDELIADLIEIRDEILKERENEDKLGKGDKYTKEQLVKALFLGAEETIKGMDLSSFHYSFFDVALISAAADIDEQEQSKLLKAVADELSQIDSVDMLATDLSGMLAVLFKGWERSAVLKTLKRLNKEHDKKIFITVGERAKGIYMIKQSFLSANSLYKNRFLYLHHGVASSDEAHRSGGGSEEIDDTARQIYAFLEINDIPKLEASLEQFQDILRQKCFSPERIKLACITLVMDLRARISKNTGNQKAEQLLSEELINSLSSMDSLYKIISTLKELFTEISNTHFGNTSKSAIERVVQYINANYSQELKLEMLANIFGYNSAYLGKVFNQYTGENFNNYIDRIRITEAKRLLSLEEYRVYEVAERVGYTNINYFHNKFKKHVGVSPLNFKRSPDLH